MASTNKRKKRMGWNMSFRDRATVYGLLAPNLLLFLALSVYPIIWALRYVFYSYDGSLGGDVTFVGLDNFVRVFTRDKDYWHSVGVTFLYALGKVAIVVPFGFLLALALNKPKRGALQALVFLPTIMSTAVMSLIFYLLLNVYNGDINRYLMALGLAKAPVEWLGAKHALVTVILVGVWGGLGNYMVYFLAGLQGIPKEIYESADLDGASPLAKTFRITLPMLGPVLKMILMLSIINAFNDMSSIMVLTEGGPFDATKVMSLYVYQFFFPISAGAPATVQFGYGSAVSVVSAMIVGAVTGLYLIASRKLDDIS